MGIYSSEYVSAPLRCAKHGCGCVWVSEWVSVGRRDSGILAYIYIYIYTNHIHNIMLIRYDNITHICLLSIQVCGCILQQIRIWWVRVMDGRGVIVREGVRLGVRVMDKDNGMDRIDTSYFRFLRIIYPQYSLAPCLYTHSFWPSTAPFFAVVLGSNIVCESPFAGWYR